MKTDIPSLRSNIATSACLVGGLLLAGAGAAHAAPAADTAMDISAIKDKLKIFTDGKNHYVAIVPFDLSNNTFFYGNGKTFHVQRVFGGGRNGDTQFNRSFWDPRAKNGGESMFQFSDKKYTMYCSTRETSFQPVPAAEGTAMIAAAKFQQSLWKRQSYLLARDEKGRYYYVDRAREPEGNHDFHLYVGPKGNLKLQPMTNVVSDSKGDIFATKRGEMRFVSGDDKSAVWLQGKARVKLVSVPIEDNHVMIYTDLGVYQGERLGTPCDDL